MDLRAGCVVDRQQLNPVQEHRFLELVREAELIAPVSGLQLISTDTDVLVRIWLVPHRRREPRTHFAAAKKVGDELEAGAVPGEQIGTRGRLPVQLGDLEHR